jgi:hypothetical protein
MAGARSALDSITVDQSAAGAPVEASPVAAGAPVVMKGYGQGNLGLGVVGGALGAAAGLVAWLALATVTGWQINLFAIVLGGLVGFGVTQGNGGRGGLGAGVIAGAFALIGVIGSQAAITHFAMESALTDSGNITEEDALDDLRWAVYDEFLVTGATMTETEDEDFPHEVMVEANRRWDALTQVEREEYQQSMRQDLDSVMAEAPLLTFGLAYLWTNGLFGLVCAGLSASTAFGIASRDAMEVAKERGLVPHVAEAVVAAPAAGTTGFRGIPPAVSSASGGSAPAPMKMGTRAAEEPKQDPMTERIIAEPADVAQATEAIAPIAPAAGAPIESAPMPLGMLARAKAPEAGPKREAA